MQPSASRTTQNLEKDLISTHLALNNTIDLVWHMASSALGIVEQMCCETGIAHTDFVSTAMTRECKATVEKALCLGNIAVRGPAGEQETGLTVSADVPDEEDISCCCMDPRPPFAHLRRLKTSVGVVFLRG